VSVTGMQRVTVCPAAGRSTQRRRQRQRCLHLNWIPWRPLVVALMASTFSGVQHDDALLESWRHAALWWRLLLLLPQIPAVLCQTGDRIWYLECDHVNTTYNNKFKLRRAGT